MKPFDDSIPEEIEPQLTTLISILRRASAGPVQMTPDEQTQLIERASQRLLVTEQTASTSEEQAVQPAESTASMSQKKATVRPVVLRRGDRVVRFANVLAAVLLIAAITGFSFLLFHHRQGPIVGTPPPPTHFPANMVTVFSDAGGFEMTLSLTPGPYFISELVAVQISLTNQTQKTANVGIPFVGSACGYVTGVQVTGEDTPQFVIPIPMDHSCPFFVNSTPIKPGQTLTSVKYLPLTNSGHLTLTAGTQFYNKVISQSLYSFPKQIASPLDGHWPTMSIDVASKVPANRTISYTRVGPRVFINAPQPVQYLYSVFCSDYNNDGGGTGTGNYGWQALTKNVVGEPGCPGKNVQWAFAFGLPGYGIVQGKVTFPGNSPNP